MLKIIWGWIFPRKSVSQLVGRFSTLATKLDSHAAESDVLATVHRTAAVEHDVTASGHEQEATRARVIAANLADLLHV